MPRRSKSAMDLPKQLEEVRELLDNFLDQIEREDLREKVLALIPIVHALRDLGSGLVVGDGINSARDRILAYFIKYPRVVIKGDELLIVAGIGEWARRFRELRVQNGWSIYTGVTLSEIAKETPDLINEIRDILQFDPMELRTDHYILMREEQDRDAAFRWQQLNRIRKEKGGVKSKILKYFRENVGHTINGEELRYLAKDKKEWARRSRELRTEDGWPIVTKMQGRPDLRVGEYVLEEDRQAYEHDRVIPDDVRIKVLERDNFHCVQCGWGREAAHPDDPRKFLELHHLKTHAKGGENTVENLVTMCNVDHDLVHGGKLAWDGGKFIPS